VSWAVFLGAFVGSLIELVEVLAVVLVVGRVAGWRNALVGAGSAVGLVAVAALVVGRGLALVPARPLELLAGVILLGFGQAWARSATRHYGGALEVPADDDERLQEQLGHGDGRGGRPSGWHARPVDSSRPAARTTTRRPRRTGRTARPPGSRFASTRPEL